MPINPDAVGTESEPFEASWNSKDALLYAVGIGAGVDDLSFTTENTDGVAQQVFPTFPVVVGWGMGSTRTSIGTFNPAMLVHGQQSVTLHKPVPVAGKVRGVSRIIGIYDKGSGAVVSTQTELVDAADGSRIQVQLDITPDDDNPFATLSALDQAGLQLAQVRVSAAFKLNESSALAWVAAGFERPG